MALEQLAQLLLARGLVEALVGDHRDRLLAEVGDEGLGVGRGSCRAARQKGERP